MLGVRVRDIVKKYGSQPRIALVFVMRRVEWLPSFLKASLARVFKMRLKSRNISLKFANEKNQL
jgi:hypothetical protein